MKLPAMTTFRPDTLVEFIDSTRYPKQRKLALPAVALLRDDMLDFVIPGTQIVVGELPDGQQYLLDGNHRCHAALAAEVEITFQVLRVQCQNMSQIDDLYLRWSNLTRVRQPGEMLRASGIAEDWQVSPDFGERAMLAVMWIDNGFQPPPKTTVSARIIAARAWDTEIRIMGNLLTGVRSDYIRRLTTAPVLAVALATLRGDRDYAVTFWHAVGQNDGLGARTAEGRMVDFLKAGAIPKAGKAQQEHARRAAHAYRMGKNKTKGGWFLVAPGPVAIEGTIYAVPDPKA